MPIEFIFCFLEDYRKNSRPYNGLNDADRHELSLKSSENTVQYNHGNPDDYHDDVYPSEMLLNKTIGERYDEKKDSSLYDKGFSDPVPKGCRAKKSDEYDDCNDADYEFENKCIVN